MKRHTYTKREKHTARGEHEQRKPTVGGAKEIIRAKKSLGQNFLRSNDVATKFVQTVGASPNDTVVEIGPGKGFLTTHLVRSARHVIAVEKDARLAGYLKRTFSNNISSGKLTVVCGDILDFDPRRFTLNAGAWKLAGSIPYYITGKLLRTFLSIEPRPSTITLIIQKEVAERIARSAKESILSLSVKAYGTPHYIATVDRRYFSPQPNVDSAILHIDAISKKFFSGFSEPEFFELVKAGFKSKRKKLSGNIAEKVPRETLSMLGVSPDARAEDLRLEEWRALARALYARAGAANIARTC